MKYSNSVQVRDGRGEYVPTAKQTRRLQEKLWGDAQRAAWRDEWLEKHKAGAEPGSLRRYMVEQAAAEVMRKLDSEDESISLDAAKFVLKQDLDYQRFEAELNGGKLPPLSGSPGMSAVAATTHALAAPVASANLLTREEAIEELQRRRRQQLQGAR